jgi:hypothetical protein
MTKNSNNTQTTQEAGLKKPIPKKKKNKQRSQQTMPPTVPTYKEELFTATSKNKMTLTELFSTSTIKQRLLKAKTARNKHKAYSAGSVSTVKASLDSLPFMNQTLLRSSSSKLKKQDKTMMAYLGKNDWPSTIDPSIRPLSFSKSATAIASLSSSTIYTSPFILGLFPTKAVNRLSKEGSSPNEFSMGTKLSVNSNTNI